MLAAGTFGWMHAGPNSVAERTPFQRGSDDGAFQRASPIGAAAYGIPLNTRSPPSTAPFSMPAGGSAMPLDSIGAVAHESPARVSETITTRWRKFMERALGCCFPLCAARA